MSASEKSELNIRDIKALGVIAGSGTLPERLIAACDRRSIDPFIVAFEGQTDPALVKGRNHMWTRLGAAGQVIHTLKSHEIKDLVMIGAIRRPSFSELVPDMRTIDFYARLGLKAIGDNNLLSAVRRLLEDEGFQIHGIHKFADELLAPDGLAGKIKPKKEDWADIERGLEVSQNLGALDVGQSVIVQEGIVLAVEAAEGTDEMIRRAKYLKRKGRGGVLVKTCKPQQDRDFDLPTIGPETVRLAIESGLSGIVVHAGHSLIIDPEEVEAIADKHKLFVIGVHPEQLVS